MSFKISYTLCLLIIAKFKNKIFEKEMSAQSLNMSKSHALEEGDFSCGNLKQKVLAIDLFDQPFYFMMPDHRDRYRTILGAVLTIITFILILGYGLFKITDLLEYKDFKLLKFEKENFYDMREPFTNKDGLMVAAAITGYNSNTEPVEDPEVGEIKFYQKLWDVANTEATETIQFIEIPSHPCTADDFAENNSDNPLFFPNKPTSKADMDIHWRKLKCINRDQELLMYGRYESQAASNLMIVFEKCDENKRTCKTPTQQAEFLEGKYILTLDNIKRFIQQEFDEARIEASSVVKWQPISNNIRTDTVILIQRLDINMNDYRFNVGSLFHDKVFGFENYQAPTRTLPYKNNFLNSITMEMSLSQIEYKRTVYSFLDFLSDLGGLFGTLGPFCGIIVTVF